MSATPEDPPQTLTPTNRGVFEAFIAPARAYPQLWRLILGILLIAVTMVLLVALQIGVLFWIVGAAAFNDWMGQLVNALSPAGTLLLMLTFAGMALGPMLAARILHKRAFLSVIGPMRLAARDFCVTGLIVAAIMAMSLGVWSFSFDAIPNVPPQIWITILPLSVAGILLQTGAEEIAFRGYLAQQLAARFARPWVWMSVTAIAFGALHYQPEVAPLSRWMVVIWATAFGLAAADLTRVSGSIGAAWGFHFANNALAILILSTEGTIPGLALYLTPYSINDAPLASTFAIDLVTTVLAWALCRRAVRR